MFACFYNVVASIFAELVVLKCVWFQIVLNLWYEWLQFMDFFQLHVHLPYMYWGLTAMHWGLTTIYPKLFALMYVTK